MSVLFDLLDSLETTGKPPEHWITRHAPDGKLYQAFSGDEAPWMARLLARVVAPRDQLPVALAIADYVVGVVPRCATHVAALLAAGHAWHGDTTSAAVLRIQWERSLTSAIDARQEAGPGAYHAAQTARLAVAIAVGADRFDNVPPVSGEAPLDLQSVVGSAENALANGAGYTRDEARAAIAALIRRHIAAPTVEEIIRAYAPLG